MLQQKAQGTGGDTQQGPVAGPAATAEGFHGGARPRPAERSEAAGSGAASHCKQPRLRAETHSQNKPRSGRGASAHTRGTPRPRLGEVGPAAPARPRGACAAPAGAEERLPPTGSSAHYRALGSPPVAGTNTRSLSASPSPRPHGRPAAPGRSLPAAPPPSAAGTQRRAGGDPPRRPAPAPYLG